MVHIDYVFVKKTAGHCLNTLRRKAPRHRGESHFLLHCWLSGRAEKQHRRGQHGQLVPGHRINQAETPGSGAARRDDSSSLRSRHCWNSRATGTMQQRNPPRVSRMGVLLPALATLCEQTAPTKASSKPSGSGDRANKAGEVSDLCNLHPTEIANK